MSEQPILDPVPQQDARDHAILRVLLLADPHPMQANTVLDHIKALTHGSRHHVYCLNCRNWSAREALEFDEFDVIIIHYSISIIHGQYLPAAFRERLRAFRGLKVMFIQDEYRQVDAYTDRMIELGIHGLFTCVPTSAVDAVYGRLRRRGVEIIPTLTGYVPDNLENRRVTPLAERPYDIVYRGRPVPFELGDLGQEKSEIARRIRDLASRFDLRVDVDWREEARIYGDRWIDFMASGRATLGTESGASIVDFDGSIAAAVEAYRAARPNADYREVAVAVLMPHEGRIVINAISPRMFEAICLRTALVLHPGEYSGVLRPWRHYIPLTKDFSNFSAVVDRLRDLRFLQQMTDTAYEEIVRSGCYDYRSFATGADACLARMHAACALRSRPQRTIAPFDPNSWRRQLDARVAQVLGSAAEPVDTTAGHQAWAAGRASDAGAGLARRVLRRLLSSRMRRAFRLLIRA